MCDRDQTNGDAFGYVICGPKGLTRLKNKILDYIGIVFCLFGLFKYILILQFFEYKLLH